MFDSPDELMRRIHNDLMDGYDEELEMELEDRHLDEVSAGSADGAALAAQKEARRTYFRELFRLQKELVK